MFTFLEKIEQRSFKEVLRELARQAGVDLPEDNFSPAERKAAAEAESERERMLRAMEVATAFFQSQLQQPGGAKAREYLQGRGISLATQEKFRVGYAPAAWDALQRHLAEKQISAPLAERLGHVGRNERGVYDFFRDRIMLPVLDRQKRPVGYSSRLLDPEAKDRKYVNSPDSPLFHKKENLYGLHAALEPIRRSGTAIVVEGNFDVMSLHEAGIEEAVAPMGTALTVEQIKQLGRPAKRIVVVFDGDGAGARAAEKAIPTAVEAGLFFADADADGRVAEMPNGMDPDEYIRAHGAEAFRALVDGARPMLDHLIQRAADDATIPGKVNTVKRVAAVLGHVRNPLVRDLYSRELAAKLGVPVAQVNRMVREEGGGAGREDPASPPREPVRSATTGVALPPKEEVDAFALLATHPEVATSPITATVFDLLRHEGMRAIFGAALTALGAGARPDVPGWLDAGPAEIRDYVGNAVMDGRWEKTEGVEDAMRALSNKLDRMRVDAELAEAKRRRAEAEARGDEEEARSLSLREMELIRTKLGLVNQSRGMTT